MSSLLPGRTSLPGQPDYVSSLLTYFSAQAGELSPACIVFPTDSSEVSIVLKTLSKFQIKFAVRGGGHTLNAGASNIDFGVVISLRSMNTVQVSDDKASVRIGGGAKWREVYAHLDPLGLAISGGRVADVGVGGLCTGGKRDPLQSLHVFKSLTNGMKVGYHSSALVKGWYATTL